MVLETDVQRILADYREQDALAKEENKFASGVEEVWNSFKRK